MVSVARVARREANGQHGAMSERLNWGILGTGMIAQKFADGLRASATGNLVRVGSRSPGPELAEEPAWKGAAIGTYGDLIDDPGVDAVYIALPNHLHAEWSIRAIQSGKDALCEKPIALNQQEAAMIFDVAETKGRTVVEAFMYPLAPINQRFIETARSGKIGELRVMRVDFSFSRPANSTDARYDWEKGGGAIMDVGCYCVHLMRTLTGREPDRVHVEGHRHELGVDDYAVGTLRFGSVLGVLSCGMTAPSNIGIVISGSEGYIQLEWPWKGASGFSVYRDRMSEPEVHEPETPVPDIYGLEADAFYRVVRKGESPWITKEDSLGNMAVMDTMRRQLGF